MVLKIQTEEGEQFEALWEQYADLVYNLSVRLTGSAKKGWVLTRTAFLDARRSVASLEGRTPSQWLTELVVSAWYTPYLEQSTFWRRHFCKHTSVRWETLIPSSIQADLVFLSDQQETLLKWLNTLDYRERLVAVLCIADSLSARDLSRISPLGESKIRKFTNTAAKKLGHFLKTSGTQVPDNPDQRIKKIASVLEQWKMLKAPLTLKADIINRRVSQKLMSHKHIPNELSLKGLILILIGAMSCLVLFLAYCYIIGKQHIPAFAALFPQ